MLDQSPVSLGRRVQEVQLLTVAEVHVDPARKARVEATDRPHDVDSLEMLLVVLLEDLVALNGVLIRTQCVEGVAWARVPRSRG